MAKVARLKVAMYGTRDAALAWEDYYSTFLESFGFVRSLSEKLKALSEKYEANIK